MDWVLGVRVLTILSHNPVLKSTNITPMAKITWAGQSCFEISVAPAKDVSATILIDPFDAKTQGVAADILLLTSANANSKAAKGQPFLIDTPGEFEIRGVFVQGIAAGKAMLYTIETEGLRFCHLGGFAESELTDEQLEQIGHVDVLMIADGSKVVGQIDPKMVIPMGDDVPKFLKAMGKTALEPVDKLTVKTSTLPKDGEMEIVVLKP